MKHCLFPTIALLLLVNKPIFGQRDDWRKLVALESTRDEVEKVLGKPEIYFDTYGLYKTELGKFSVWYSKGVCSKQTEGLQYNIPAKRMTRLYVRLEKAGNLEDFMSKGSRYVK